MAAYEQPTYLDHIPGYAPRSSHDYGSAPGSDGEAYQREDPTAHLVVGTPIVTTPFASSQVEADIPRRAVLASDVNVVGQVPQNEPFTNVGNTWRETVGHDDPSSHVVTPDHPNSNGVNRA